MAEKKKSVYSGIADDIISKIKDGTYSVGSLLPPEREFMVIYKVQRTTVRRGLEILSAEGYIRKAAGLGSVVVSSVPVETSVDITQVIKAERKPSGDYGILISKDKPLDKMPHLVIDTLAHLGKDKGTLITSDISEIKDGNIVCIDTDPDTKKNVCLALCQSDERRSVILDNDKGAYVALTYLESLGHTKIAFIGTDSGLSFENAAYDSFSAVNSFFDEELVNLSGSDEKSGFDGFSELFRRHGGKFTAVCTVNDEVAKGVIKAAKYYKVNVPEEMSVISLCSAKAKPSVDAIYYNPSELAEEILESAKACLRVSTVLFGGKLVVSGSSSSIKEASENGKRMSDFLL